MISTKGRNASFIRDISITLVISLSVILMISVFEEPLTYNNGLGWDGVLYYRIAQQIHNGEKIINEAPFKGYQLLEYIFITGIILLGIIQKQRTLSQYGATT